MKARFLSLVFIVFAAQFASAQVNEKKGSPVQTTAQQEDLKIYKGAYETPGNGDIVVVFDNGKQLSVKIPGKPTIVMETTGKHLFKSEKEGMVLEFAPEKGQFVMTQNGVAQTYTKAKA